MLTIKLETRDGKASKNTSGREWEFESWEGSSKTRAGYREQTVHQYRKISTKWIILPPGLFELEEKSLSNSSLTFNILPAQNIGLTL